MHSKTRLTEQSGPLFKVTKGSRLRLLGEDVAVQYNDVTSSPIYATAKGVDKQNREFYIISAMGPLPEHIDFGGFKKEKSNFIFIINILLPAKTVIVLPKHAECYLVHQEHQDYVVRGLPYFHFINVASPDHVKKIDLIKHKRQQPDLIEQAEQTQSTIPQKKQKEAEPQVAQYNMPLFLQSRRRWNELKWARVKYYPIKVIERLQAQHRQHSIEQQLANNMFAFSMCKMQRCDLLPTDRPYAVQWLAALSSIRSNHHLIVTANSQAKQEWLKELNTGKVQAGVITPQMMEMSMNDIIHQIYQSACWVVCLDEVDSKQLDFMPFNTVLLDNIDVALDLPRNCQQINFHADNAALREKQGKFDLSKLTPWAAENAYQEEYQQVQTDYCRSAMHDPMGTLLANFERDKTWPLSKAIPRPHQLLCMQQYLQTRHANQHAAFVMSTGSGKTAVFVNVAALTNDRVIVEVPRDNLVAQTIEAFKEFTPDIKVAQAYFNGDKTNINSTQIQVLVITYQLLQLHDHKVDWSKVKALYLDEAHNSLSAKRTAIVEAAKAANVKICTFTATPTLDLKRDDDDEGHEDVYSLCGFASDGSDCPITRFTIRDAIQAGANVPVVMHHVMPINFDDDVIKFKSTRSISENEAARIMDNPKCNKILCDLYLNGADPVSNRPYRGQKGVIFCSGIAHAKHVESMFDEAILSSYQLTAEDQEKITEQYYRMEEKAYVKQNRKAKNKNVPPYQRGQHWVTEEQKSKYMELAKAKCRRRLALDLIDPHGVLRKRYADNVAADFKKREGSDLSKEDWQQAYDSFRIVKAVYSPSANADIDNLSDKKCEKILKKYRLGGYLLLAGADKLTEGFDDPEVNFIAFLRPTSSERVMTQGSGRGLRVNPADNDKVCSIFQFHMTRNIASYRMVHELISEELTPIFQFGEADERRKRQGERHQQQATKVIPLPIAGLSEYHVISKPDQGQIHLPPLPEPRQRSAGTKKQRQTGTRSHARPVIEQTLIE